MKVIPIKGRHDWLAQRKMDVTASEVPALFGASAFTTALQVYADKTGKGKGYGDNVAMRAGRIMEPAIAEAVREERPQWVLNKATSYYRDEDRRIGCTPDYFRVDQPDVEVVECKFVQPHVFEADWKDGPPLMYVLQTLVQVHVIGCPRGWIACMIDNRAKDVFIYEVPRNDNAWARICAAVDKFWEAVHNGELPNPDYVMDMEVLRDLFPPDKSKPPLDLMDDDDFITLLVDRQVAMETMKRAEADKRRAEAEIIDRLKGSTAAVTTGFRISYKSQTRPEHVVPASTFSVLRVTETKKG